MTESTSKKSKSKQLHDNVETIQICGKNVYMKPNDKSIQHLHVAGFLAVVLNRTENVGARYWREKLEKDQQLTKELHDLFEEMEFFFFGKKGVGIQFKAAILLLQNVKERHASIEHCRQIVDDLIKIYKGNKQDLLDMWNSGVEEQELPSTGDVDDIVADAQVLQNQSEELVSQYERTDKKRAFSTLDLEEQNEQLQIQINLRQQEVEILKEGNRLLQERNRLLKENREIETNAMALQREPIASKQAQLAVPSGPSLLQPNSAPEALSVREIYNKNCDSFSIQESYIDSFIKEAGGRAAVLYRGKYFKKPQRNPWGCCVYTHEDEDLVIGALQYIFSQSKYKDNNQRRISDMLYGH